MYINLLNRDSIDMATFEGVASYILETAERCRKFVCTLVTEKQLGNRVLGYGSRLLTVQTRSPYIKFALSWNILSRRCCPYLHR